jgi:phosphate transport system protein
VSYYEERLEKDLQAIRSGVQGVSDRVEGQIRNAVKALVEHDAELAGQVILQDRVVNRATRDLDRACHQFVIRHLPVAHHLRFVSSVLRLDVALERVGDYAVTICRHSLRCSGPPPERVARDIELVSQQARHALGQSLKAFHEEDVELARSALGLASQVDATHDKAFEDLVATGERHERPIRDIFGFLRSLYSLLRVADQAENIAQETLFAVAGEIKDSKVYRILFVDRADDCRALLAEAYARKAFSDCGIFTSGGWEPAETIRPELFEFLDRHGLPTEGLEPKPVPDLLAETKHFHVVIGLDEGASDHVGEIPFKTVFLNWALGPCPSADGDLEATQRLEEIYRGIATRLRDLMDTLRGPDVE